MMPKFSIRQLLLAMIGIALISLCMSLAYRGNRPALGLSVAIVGSFLPILVYALVHWLAIAVALLPFNGGSVASAASPTALPLGGSESLGESGSKEREDDSPSEPADD